MEETTKKRNPWPTGLFDCCSGGTSVCLWGFLCPLCLDLQRWTYSRDLSSKSSSSKPMSQSQFERYPPWSCRGIACADFVGGLFSYCLCLHGIVVGIQRHERYSARANFEYYCSSRVCCCSCCCCDELAIEDCLIGYFCYCCSIIQMTMANDEHFRMQSKVEGDLNIKRAL